MNTLSSHVLDTTNGLPAANIALTLTMPNDTEMTGMTNEDGRFSAWQTSEFTAGQYKMRFHCKEYLMKHHGNSFYPYIDIHFEMTENGGHYHIPLLVSPFGFSSYKGS